MMEVTCQNHTSRALGANPEGLPADETFNWLYSMQFEAGAISWVATVDRNEAAESSASKQYAR